MYIIFYTQRSANFLISQKSLFFYFFLSTNTPIINLTSLYIVCDLMTKECKLIIIITSYLKKEKVSVMLHSKYLTR